MRTPQTIKSSIVSAANRTKDAASRAAGNDARTSGSRDEWVWGEEDELRRSVEARRCEAGLRGAHCRLRSGPALTGPSRAAVDLMT
jgi:hypothetical protein